MFWNKKRYEPDMTAQFADVKQRQDERNAATRIKLLFKLADMYRVEKSNATLLKLVNDIITRMKRPAAWVDSGIVYLAFNDEQVINQLQDVSFRLDDTNSEIGQEMLDLIFGKLPHDGGAN